MSAAVDARGDVLLFGLFGSGNSGNDASLDAILAILARVRPDLAPVCLCAEPEAARARFGIPAEPFGAIAFRGPLARGLDRLLAGVPRRLASFARAVSRARRATALVFPGTGILDDFGTGPTGMPLAVLGWCVAARLAGVPIAFVSIGAGPVRHPVSRRMMARAAALARYLTVRDAGSRDFLNACGVAVDEAAVTPDLAFGLPLPAHLPPRSPDRSGSRLAIGLGVMGYYGWRHDARAGATIHAAYVQKLRRVGLGLLERGASLRILTGDVGDDETAAELAAALRSARPDLPAERIVLSPTADLRVLMRHVASLDVVVATRFHTMVSALAMGRPAVSIGYARKNRELLAAVDLAHVCQDIETLDPERLLADVDAVLRERDDIAARIAPRIAVFRERLAAQETRLATLLASAPRRAASRPADLATGLRARGVAHKEEAS